MCAQVSVQVRHPLDRGEPRTPGKENFQRGTLCVKAWGASWPGQPPLPSLPSLLPTSQSSAQCLGVSGLPVTGRLAASSRLGVPRGRRKGTYFWAPQGLNTHFSSVDLGRFLPELLPKFREGRGVTTRAGWRQGPCSPGQAPGPLAFARTSARPPGKTWAGTPGRCCCAPCRRR